MPLARRILTGARRGGPRDPRVERPLGHIQGCKCDNIVFTCDEGARPMPTLDVRGVPIGANITVNYSSLLPMTPHMQKQLEDAVALARDTIIRVNTDVYKPLYNF